MLYSYKEVKNIYKTTYQIRKALKDKKIYKIEKGIYSDKPYVNYLSVLTKKYPYAIISGESACYYYDFTDVIPDKIYIVTHDDDTRIHDENIKQIRTKENLYDLGRTQIEYEGVLINIYDKERMLIELARNKNQMGYDLYKEIVSNYRNQVDQLDIGKIEEYSRYFANGDKILRILQDEIF